MFNLDLAISEWRRQMAAGGIKSREVLAELESHLRDDVEQQMREGSGVAAVVLKKLGVNSERARREILIELRIA